MLTAQKALSSGQKAKAQDAKTRWTILREAAGMTYSQCGPDLS